MKYFIYGVLVFFHYALMTTILPLLLPTFIAIDFAIICVVCIAMFTKNYTAAIFGLSIGLLFDLFTGPAFGLYMLFYGLLGLGAAKLFDRFHWDNILVAVGTIFVAYLLRDGYLYMFRLTERIVFPTFGMFIKFSCLSAIITAALGFAWFLGLQKLHEARSLRIKQPTDYHLYDYGQEDEWR